MYKDKIKYVLLEYCLMTFIYWYELPMNIIMYTDSPTDIEWIVPQ